MAEAGLHACSLLLRRELCGEKGARWRGMICPVCYTLGRPQREPLRRHLGIGQVQALLHHVLG